MVSGIPDDEAAAISITLEGFYMGSITVKWVHPISKCSPVASSGFSLLMFIGTIWALTNKRSLHDVNRPITVVVILLFLLSTAVSQSPPISGIIC